MKTRRTFMDCFGRLGVAGAVMPWLPGCGSLRTTPALPAEHYDLVVIGSGFGGTLTALRVMNRLNERLGNRPTPTPLRILMLERGTWWTTPTETVQDKQVKTRDFLIAKGQPTQEWSTLADFRGMLDLLRRCRYSEERPQGLYDFTPIGKRGLLNLQNDGVSVLRASGVGGGSLIYSKILLRPPETLFDDPRWPSLWRGANGLALRNRCYKRALQAVTVGVHTLPDNDRDAEYAASQILMRSASIPLASVREAPPTMAKADPKRPIWQINVADKQRLTGREGELIDRARVFQTAMRALMPPNAPTYGTVDLSISDRSTETARNAVAKNYCERHGRCNIGCLVGAGQTLNKQLFRAVYGDIETSKLDREPAAPGPCPVLGVALKVAPLAQAQLISEREGGGYLVHYRQRRVAEPAGPADDILVSADRVILAAGCLGTSELLLRCQQRALESAGAQGLRGLSPRLGHGFSANGDHIAFLAGTRERINLTYGPVTTSYGQFNANAPRADGFHQVEDQGVPRALGALTGHGLPVIEKLADGESFAAIVEGLNAVQKIFTRFPTRRSAARDGDLSADRGEAEDELTANIMCVVAQGKDAANGRFRLEGGVLRMAREDKKRFHQDPIYDQIRTTLDKLAVALRDSGSSATFISPTPRTVLTSHPLGGCPMGESVDSGVVDASGRVFRQASAGGGFHRGLYIADGSIVPTALGVNPALTISALALNIAEQVLAEWDHTATRTPRPPTALQCNAAARPA
jgi:choline dehydrogenase-like flavoprotein